MLERVLRVKELNDYIAGVLTHDPLLRNLFVQGEIANFRITSAGHAYFSLRDDDAAIACVSFRNAVEKLTFMPMDGQRVCAYGYISIYAASGQMQLYIQEMEEVGMGPLFAEFEAQKQELDKLGYFDLGRKRPLPAYPRCIGVVTSPTGAVLHDIANVCWRRNPAQHLLLAPSAVQGQDAARQIVAGIEALNQIDDVDLIIVARGGGSFEDLWPFNERIVADAIFHSEKPVVSAVGHETDTTISDFVADLRAPTPSAAAELCTPLTQQAMLEHEALLIRMQRSMDRRIEQQKERLIHIQQGVSFDRPRYALQEKLQTLDSWQERLQNAGRMFISGRRNELMYQNVRLEANGPTLLMNRGYVLAEKAGQLVSSIEGLQTGDALRLYFRDGQAQVSIEEIRLQKKENGSR